MTIHFSGVFRGKQKTYAAILGWGLLISHCVAYSQLPSWFSWVLSPKTLDMRIGNYVNNDGGIVPYLGLGYNVFQLQSSDVSPDLRLFADSVRLHFSGGIGSKTDNFDRQGNEIYYRFQKAVEERSFETNLEWNIFTYLDKYSLIIRLPIVGRSSYRNPQTTNEIWFDELGVSSGVCYNLSSTLSAYLDYQWSTFLEQGPPILRKNYQMVNLGISFSLPQPTNPTVAEKGSPKYSVQIRVTKPPGYNIEGDSMWSHERFEKLFALDRNIQPVTIKFEAVPDFIACFIDITIEPIDKEYLRGLIRTKLDSISHARGLHDAYCYITNSQTIANGNLQTVMRDKLLQQITNLEPLEPNLFYNELTSFVPKVQSYLADSHLDRAHTKYELYLSRSTFLWLQKDTETFSRKLYDLGLNASNVTIFIESQIIGNNSLSGCKIVGLETVRQH